MKRLFYIITVIISIMLMSGCNSKSKAGSESQDSANGSEATAVNDSVQEEAPLLTSEGIFLNNKGIRVGQPLDSLLSTIPGLYDNLHRDATPDAEVVSAMLGPEQMFIIYSLDTGVVDVITVESPRIKTQGGIYLGMPFMDFLKTEGVSTEWASLDDTGQWYWRANGLWILPEYEDGDSKLMVAMHDHRMPPPASVISPESTVSYISTGLPF